MTTVFSSEKPDIVERLRKPTVPGFLHPIDLERREAAAEIEQLRAANNRLSEWASKQVMALEAEIERLRTRLEKAERLLKLSGHSLVDGEWYSEQDND